MSSVQRNHLETHGCCGHSNCRVSSYSWLRPSPLGMSWGASPTCIATRDSHLRLDGEPSDRPWYIRCTWAIRTSCRPPGETIVPEIMSPSTMQRQGCNITSASVHGRMSKPPLADHCFSPAVLAFLQSLATNPCPSRLILLLPHLIPPRLPVPDHHSLRVLHVRVPVPSCDSG